MPLLRQVATAAAHPAHTLLDGVHLTDTAAAAVVVGDLIRGNATPAWDRLGIGAAGNVLTVVAGVPAWAAPAGGGAVTKVSKQTLAAPGTQLNWIGLSINAAGLYEIMFNLKNNTGVGTSVYLYCDDGLGNLDLVNANYYNEGLYAGGAVASAANANNPAFAWLAANDFVIGRMLIFLDLNTQMRVLVNIVDRRTVNIQNWQIGIVHNAASADITKIRFLTTQNMAIGSTATMFAWGL